MPVEIGKDIQALTEDVKALTQALKECSAEAGALIVKLKEVNKLTPNNAAAMSCDDLIQEVCDYLCQRKLAHR